MIGDTLRPFPRREPVVQAIPGQPRPEVGEVIGRIAARQHVEHAFEHRPAQFGKRRGAADRLVQGVDVPVVGRHHRDDLLREHVERIARIAARFDARLVHRAGDGGARDQVAAEFRDDDAAAGGADGVAGASDALHPARDRWRRLDLDHQIDGPHVDAELERRGGDQAAEDARLESIFDFDALRARQRPVVRADEHLARQLVERGRQPFRDPAAVDEDQRRSVRLHQFEQTRVDRGPDRLPRRRLRRRATRDLVALADLRHVLDRDLDPEVELLLLARCRRS